jgi:hypothetical protein
MRFINPIIIFVVILLMQQCNKSAGAEEIEQHSSINKEKIQSVKKDSPVRKEINYFPLVLKNKSSAFVEFDKKYSKEEIHAILALNRLDFKNRWRADTLVIPNVLEKDFNVYSPFPKTVTLAKDIHKLALFCYPIHAYALYEKGRLIKWGPTSMGKKKTPTKIGLGFTNWKKKIAISTSNSEWKLRWNFNVFNYLGIGWHQYDLPGYHASHSCIRLLEEDAFWMYSWADQWILNKEGTQVLAKGTPVIIFGEPNFSNKPWLRLLKSAKANDYTEEQINTEIQPFLAEILKQQNAREKYLMSVKTSVEE